MGPGGRRPPVTGPRIWAWPLAGLLALLLAPFLLYATPFLRLAEAWRWILILAAWVFFTAALVGAMAKATTPPLAFLERWVRQWVARFAPDPEALWLHWARHAHHPALGWWCLAQACREGGAEALFQEGLVYLEGGLGPGGAITAVDRLTRAASLGHPEAAFRLAEALRTGQGCASEPAAAEAWYRRSAAAGFGRAAAWLAHAYACGDGLAPDPEQARSWGEAAARLAPHPPLQHSPLHHAAAPADPLVQAQAAAMARLEAGMDQLVARRTGRWVLLTAAALLGAFFLFAVGAFFWAGSSQLYHLPLLLLAVPLAMLGRQAWRLRREGPRTGRDRLREKAEKGDPEACYRVGLACRRGGAGHPPDDLTAALWFRRAAEAGHPGAMLALADAYRSGQGVVRDPRLALQWEAAARADADQLADGTGR
jgi:hypothetical protein